MHPEIRGASHPVRTVALKLTFAVLALIGLVVVAYFLFVGAIIVAVVALAVIGAAMLVARLVRRR